MESSAVVAALLEHDTAAMESVAGHVRLVTSALTFTETARAIVRARVTDRLTADQELAAVRALKTFSRRCFVLDVDSVVLSRAGRRFPVEPIRTLDALHLATAELLDDSLQLVTVVTRDARVRENALAMGFAVA
jgi:predicted nucleic acid-binding protein